MTVRILIGDVRAVLKTLADDSVDCSITSPPYWGLRSYLPAGHPQKHLEIGSEPTVHEWVRTMVEVFGEVRRVLKPAGTLWLNLGDSYAGGFRGEHRSDTCTLAGTQPNHSMVPSRRRDKVAMPRPDRAQAGLKPKDMVGQPWRAALALQGHAVIDCKSIAEWADLLQQARAVGDWSLVEAVEKRLRAWDFTESMKRAGWWLRQEIIWAKRSPMPESMRDRLTKSHEHVFLLAKSQTYYFDFDAIQEPASMGTHERAASTGVGFGHGFDEAQKPRVTPKAALATSGNDGAYADGKSERIGRGAGWRNKNNASFDQAMAAVPATRNPRSVRWLASEPFRGAHFATYPPELIRPFVRAGSFRGAHFATYPPELIRPFVRAGCPPGGTVLDCFGGSGTTGLVADQEGRNAILIDLDERNAPMAEDRITAGAPLFAQVDTQEQQT